MLHKSQPDLYNENGGHICRDFKFWLFGVYFHLKYPGKGVNTYLYFWACCDLISDGDNSRGNELFRNISVSGRNGVEP